MSSAAGRRLPPAEVDCMWWKRGYCARGRTCHFRHDEAIAGVDNRKPTAAIESRMNGTEAAIAPLTTPATAPIETAGPSTPTTAYASSPTSSQICTICLETPDTFGLLLNCDHVFCLECIRNWRSSTSAPLPSNDELKSTSKTCPMCRSHSDYIIPSSIFPAPPPLSSSSSTNPRENPQKSEITHRYLARLSSIPCRYFTSSLISPLPSHSSPTSTSTTTPPPRPKCKFGNSCHYAHIHPSTNAPYIFSAEELAKPRRRTRRNVAPMGLAEEMALLERLFADLRTEGELAEEWGCDEEDVDGDGDVEEELDMGEGDGLWDVGGVGGFLESEFQGVEMGFDNFDLDWDEVEYNFGWDF